jgi:hypothetical protein
MLLPDGCRSEAGGKGWRPANEHTHRPSDVHRYDRHSSTHFSALIHLKHKRGCCAAAVRSFIADTIDCGLGRGINSSGGQRFPRVHISWRGAGFIAVFRERRIVG